VSLAALTVALALVVLVPATAQASNLFSGYVTTVTGIRPHLPGVSARAEPDGADITVHNTSSTPLVIEGYQHEPYLKITDHGVWENRLSPAVYLNKEQFIGSIPDNVNAQKPPIWVKVDGRSFATWHDHRIHWMDVTQPPSVAAAPGKPHLIKRWTIPLVSGGRRGAIVGTLTWQPSSHLGTYLTIGVVALAMVAVGVLVVLRRRRRPRGPANPSGPAQPDEAPTAPAA
jgi:hypothetical protein